MIGRLRSLAAGTAAALLAGCAIDGPSAQQPIAESLNVHTYPLGAYSSKPLSVLPRASVARGSGSYAVKRASRLVYVATAPYEF